MRAIACFLSSVLLSVPLVGCGAVPASAESRPAAGPCADGTCPTWDSRQPLPAASMPPGCPVGDPGRVTADGRTVEGLGPCDPPAAHLGSLR